ncbi:MAG: hypothetical protein ACK55I_31675 [bacterium]
MEKITAPPFTKNPSLRHARRALLVSAGIVIFAHTKIPLELDFAVTEGGTAVPAVSRLV